MQALCTPMTSGLTHSILKVETSITQTRKVRQLVWAPC